MLQGDQVVKWRDKRTKEEIGDMQLKLRAILGIVIKPNIVEVS